MPPKNVPVHVECIIVSNFLVSATEAELVGFLGKFQKAAAMKTDLSEMGHQKPSTPVATDNTAANRIFNGTAKQNRF